MKYGCIAADPCWNFENFSEKGEAKNAIPANIRSLPVSKRTAPEGAGNTRRSLTIHARKEREMASSGIPRLDLTGQQFGRLTVLREAPSRHSPNGDCHRYWVCRCECGTEKEIAQQSLRRGYTVSCGCYWKELKPNQRHGKADTAEYHIWCTMKARCSNPGSEYYHRYGGRGITVCERWQSFDSFLADMGPRPSEAHTIERKDNDGPYSPDNCIWADQHAQSRNRSNNRILEFQGVRLTVTDWAERVGISERTLFSRLQRGWSVERVLTTKPRGKR